MCQAMCARHPLCRVLPVLRVLFALLTVATVRGVVSAADWVDQRQVGRFHLLADYSLDGSDRLLADLHQLERDMTAALGLSAGRDPIHLILFRDQASYDRYMGYYFRGAPARRALFIKGSMPGWVFAYQSADHETDVRHETVHALLHDALPDVPLWLDEGLAEYYEQAAGQRVSDNPYLSATKWDAWLRRVPSLTALEALRDVNRMQADDYRAAWAWVHFMLHGPPAARRVLVEYLADLRTHPGPVSLSERLQAAVPDLERQYLNHFRGWRR